MKSSLILSIVIISAILVGGVAFYAISTSNKQNNFSQTPSNPSPQGNLNAKQDVLINNFAFSPQTVTIKAGMYVIWANQDSAPHTVISDTGSEISSPSLSKGETYVHQFTEAGTYTYHCSVHPSMKGTIVVQ
jgi:plastocyanin